MKEQAHRLACDALTAATSLNAKRSAAAWLGSAKDMEDAFPASIRLKGPKLCAHPSLKDCTASNKALEGWNAPILNCKKALKILASDQAKRSAEALKLENLTDIAKGISKIAILQHAHAKTKHHLEAPTTSAGIAAIAATANFFRVLPQLAKTEQKLGAAAAKGQEAGNLLSARLLTGMGEGEGEALVWKAIATSEEAKGQANDLVNSCTRLRFSRGTPLAAGAACGCAAACLRACTSKGSSRSA